jgi:endonuclease III
MGGDPWKVAVASILVAHSSRPDIAFDALMRRWPGPEALARADERAVIAETELHRQKARQLIRFSTKWFSEYDDFRELPGVGSNVANDVCEYCFGVDNA